MRTAAGSLLVAAILVIAAFGASLVAGYVYSHDPQPERIEVRVDSSTPPDSEQILAGTIGTVSNGSADVTTVLGTTAVDLAGVVVEDLEPLGDALPATGASANLGGTRADTGYVLSGVVVVESTP